MSRRRVFFRPRSASKGDVVDEQSDLYRRIDELLSRPTDEQVREQHALNDLMVSVRDAIARLTGDVAALAARVSETREYAERMADRPTADAPSGPAEMPRDLTTRLDALETAIGQLAASMHGPGAPAEAPDLTPLVHITVPEAIRGSVPGALRDVIPDAIREAVPEAIRGVIPDAVRSAIGDQMSQLAGSGGA